MYSTLQYVVRAQYSVHRPEGRTTYSTFVQHGTTERRLLLGQRARGELQMSAPAMAQYSSRTHSCQSLPVTVSHCHLLSLSAATSQLSCASGRNFIGLTGWAVVGEVEKRERGDAQSLFCLSSLRAGVARSSIALFALCHYYCWSGMYNAKVHQQLEWLSLSAPPVAAVAVCMWRVHSCIAFVQ
jgi:hypothetical protein